MPRELQIHRLDSQESRDNAFAGPRFKSTKLEKMIIMKNGRFARIFSIAPAIAGFIVTGQALASLEPKVKLQPASPYLQIIETRNQDINFNKPETFGVNIILGEKSLTIGDYDQALKYYDEAIHGYHGSPLYLNRYADAFFGRGEVYFFKGEFAKAIPEIDKYLNIIRWDASGYLLRGIAKFYLGKMDEAESDFKESIQRKHAYGVLWLHLVRKQAGIDDSVEFKSNLNNLKDKSWPVPLIEFLAGTIDDAALESEGKKAETHRSRGATLCEIPFYKAAFDIAGKDTRKNYEIAANKCPGDFYERGAALQQLRILQKFNR